MRIPPHASVLTAALMLAIGAVSGAAVADDHDVPETVPLPDEFLGGYVEAWQTTTYPDDVPHANMTMVAFATTTAERRAEMSYHMPSDELAASIASNAAAGHPTMLSLGGSGDWYAPSSDAHAGIMADDLIAIIESHGFSGLDVNFEGGSEGFNESNASYTADMMRQVHDHFVDRGLPFTLSIAPYGANRDGQANSTVSRTYLEIMRQNVDIIDFVGFQYYNTGFPVDTAWVRNVLDHWKAEVPGLTNDQWALGFLRVHDWGGETTPYQSMLQIWDDIQESHPGVRGVWTWGVNEKETPTGYGFFTTFESVIDGSGVGDPVTQPGDEDPVTQPGDEDPVTQPPGGGFSDVSGGTHADAIERMAAADVIEGYPDGTFRPARSVTRGQVASLLARSLGLDPTACGGACDALSDIDGGTHEEGVRATVAAGIAEGYTDGTFRADDSVSREQLATFFAGAFDLPSAGGGHPFIDVEGSTHEDAIGALAQAGITTGTTATTFAPRDPVRRDQMASFLDRALSER